MKKFSRFLLKLFGWDIDKHVPEGVKKCVVVMGPHTSNWDFIVGRLAFLSYGVKTGILIKSELFFFPLGLILRALGGLPIRRKSHNNFTDQAKELFDKTDTMFMVFTPEGTRSYNPNWKKGFYYVAQKVNVPIYLTYMDYERKIGGFLELFEPTGDVEKDIAYIKEKLSQFKGRNPENGIRKVEDE